MRTTRLLSISVALACALLAAACGGDSKPAETPDAAITPDAPACTPPIGFTFGAIGDRSFASFGAAGTLHNVRVPDGTPFGTTVTSCDGCDGVCRFEGPTKPLSPVNRKRCLNRMSVTCETDADCTTANGDSADDTPYRRCVYMYDAPAATPLRGIGGRPGACGWSYIPIAAAGQQPTVRGTLDLGSGDLNIEALTIFLPLNGTGGTYRGACAECIGDDIANDGVKNGTCTLSTRGGNNDASPDIGQPCDVHRFGDIPGFEGTYSMDCAPTVRTADGSPNVFGGQFTSSGYQIEVTASSPSCTYKDASSDLTGEKCFCGYCAPDPANPAGPLVECLSNADCGGRECGYAPPSCNPNPYPYNPDGVSPPFTFVNPMNPAQLPPSGPEGDVYFDPRFAPTQCRGADRDAASDAARTYTATAGNSCKGPCTWNPTLGLGTCTSRLTNATVGCYPTGLGMSIVAPGGARKQGNVYIADTATARCNRATPSPTVNAQLGLPGITFQKRSFRILPEYPQ